MLGFFSKAGANGHVFFLRSGKVDNKGLAYSGFALPGTTVAVVPTITQIIDFQFDVTSEDKQAVKISGNLKVSLKPDVAVAHFDFTVDPHTGTTDGSWLQVLKALVLEQVQRPVRDDALVRKLETLVSAHSGIENKIKTGLNHEALLEKGIKVDSCSIAVISPMDNEVSKALGASERQIMLTAADLATHARRQKSSENERALQQYEADTALELEKKRTALLEQQGENKKKEAEDDAVATAARLAPFKDVEAGKAVAAALMAFANGGSVDKLVLGSELFGTMKST